METTGDTSGMGSGSAHLSPEMEAHLVACIHESLSLYLHDNAQFLCERLVAAFPSQVRCESCFLKSFSPVTQQLLLNFVKFRAGEPPLAGNLLLPL